MAGFREPKPLKEISLPGNRRKGGGKNVIVMYTCKDNLTPLQYSGKIKKIIKKKRLNMAKKKKSNLNKITKIRKKKKKKAFLPLLSLKDLSPFLKTYVFYLPASKVCRSGSGRGNHYVCV